MWHFKFLPVYYLERFIEVGLLCKRLDELVILLDDPNSSPKRLHPVMSPPET
jgi:hypothetical protein